MDVGNCSELKYYSLSSLKRTICRETPSQQRVDVEHVQVEKQFDIETDIRLVHHCRIYVILPSSQVLASDRKPTKETKAPTELWNVTLTTKKLGVNMSTKHICPHHNSCLTSGACVTMQHVTRVYNTDHTRSTQTSTNTCSFKIFCELLVTSLK